MTQIIQGQSSATHRLVRSARRRRRMTATVSIAAAMVGGLIVWAIAVPVAGIQLTDAVTGYTVGPAGVAASTLVGGLAALLLLIMLRRFTRGLTIWTTVGCCVLVLSFVGPALSSFSSSALLVLELMHVVAGVVLIVGLRLSAHTGPVRRSDA